MVIVGGESGPGARPMALEWVTGIRDACAWADVPFFFKQWGDWHPIVLENDHFHCHDPQVPFGRHSISQVDGRGWIRVGKARAGAKLYGREHRAMPAWATV